MKKATASSILGIALLLAVAVLAQAQQPAGTSRIGILAATSADPDLGGKRLELLKEVFPKLDRVVFLWEPGTPRGNEPLTDMEAAAKALRLTLISIEVRSVGDFEGAFARAKKERGQALITKPGPLFNTQQRQILDFAAKNRLLAIYPTSEFVEAGGLMSYAPIEQPIKFEFIVNLKAAKQIGLTVPANVLARADRIIK
jgi:putative ABC transport system substrate-binding protein